MSSFTGLRFHLSLPRAGLQKAAPRMAPMLAAGSLRLEHLPYPSLPDREWIELAPLMAGICGSDLGVLTARSSPYLSPLSSFPAVLGHEVVAQVVTKGHPAWAYGSRVVVKPEVSCHTWGQKLCPRCTIGDRDNCHERTSPTHHSGLLMGYHHLLPGGWGTRMWAPVEQLYAIEPDMPLRRAVLTEPLAIVSHAFVQVDWESVSTVLIIGAGTMGILNTLLLGVQYPGRDVWVRAKYPHQAHWVKKLGAHNVSDDDNLARYTGIPRSTMWGSAAWRAEGFDLVIDTVGTSKSVSDSLTLTKPGGQVLLVGGAGILQRVDLSPLWVRNIRWIGTYGYGRDLHAFSNALHILYTNHLPLEDLVTHSFPLTDYRQAFATAWNHSSESIKIVFLPTLPPAT